MSAQAYPVVHQHPVVDANRREDSGDRRARGDRRDRVAGREHHRTIRTRMTGQPARVDRTDRRPHQKFGKDLAFGERQRHLGLHRAEAATPDRTNAIVTRPRVPVAPSVGPVADHGHAFHHALSGQEVVAHHMLGCPVVPKRDATGSPTESALHIRDRRSAL